MIMNTTELKVDNDLGPCVEVSNDDPYPTSNHARLVSTYPVMFLMSYS